MTTRNVSTSSSFSLKSNGSKIQCQKFINNLPSVNTDEVLRYTTIVVLLEYINEPRFRKREVTNAIPLSRELPPKTSRTKEASRAKRRSWLFSDDIGKKDDISEAKQLQRFIPALENYLKMVTINKIELRKGSLRRSLLKFYNDRFLDPKASNQLSTLTRLDELIILFTKAAQTEIAKVPSRRDDKHELYSQICDFTDVISSIVLGNESSNSQLKLRLKEYKESFGNSKGAVSSLSPISPNSEPRTNLIESSIKPSFKISDVKISAYLMELFDISEVEFQQELIKCVNVIDIDAVGQSIRTLKEKTMQQGNLGPEPLFSDLDVFRIYQEKELQELGAMTARLASAYQLHTEAGGKGFGAESNYFPKSSANIYVQLLRMILDKEADMHTISLNLSKEALFLINKCASYWRLTWPSTKASLILTAANAGPLAGKCLNPVMFEKITGLISTRVFGGADIIEDHQLWKSIDQNIWLDNMICNLEQTFNILCLLVSEIHQKPRPKFSQTLKVYYEIISSCELLGYDVTNSELYRKYMRRLRRSFFKATEHFYVSLVRGLPRDRLLEFFDVKNIADSIVSEIQMVQKMYPKALLDEVSLPVESGRTLTEAFGLDCAPILSQIEVSNNQNDSKLPLQDAVETYKSLRELQDVYNQVQGSKRFPCKLEKYFLKYVSKLCDEACESTVDVVQTAIAKETWEPISTSLGYSTSVIDVFKMINESIDLFVKLDWQSRYQISKIYTYLLKAVADGLSLYSSAVTDIIESDIKTIQEETQVKEKDEDHLTNLNPFAHSTKTKMKNSWVYTEMKNALKSADVVAPQPFEFKLRTCTCLSNLNQMLLLINGLEDRIDPEGISKVIRNHEQVDAKSKMMTEKQNRSLRRLYTIKVIRAENLSSSAQESNVLAAVSIVDTKLRREVARTREVLKSGRPVWNEEFELDAAMNETRFLNIILWYHKTKFGSLTPSVHGRASLGLEPNKFSEDGLPQQVCLNLDTRGRILVEIAVETEKLDALFSMGKAFRSVTRARDRSIELVVNKFQVFVYFAFSISTLKTVCGPNGISQASESVIYDSIVPLFDYLNSNLNILASHLPRELLLKIMLEVWEVVLIRADELLLPFLYDVHGQRNSDSKTKVKSIWENAVDAAKHGINSSINSERPLTQIEVHTVFEWLRALCVDFFHNNGEGPALKDLKNKHYQALLFIPVYYDKSVVQLKAEAETLHQEYRNLLFSTNDNKDAQNDTAPKLLGKRTKSIARRKTVLANASRKRRVQLDKEIEAAENNPLDSVTATQDILLRILIAKGETDYVARSLELRESLNKALFTENIVKAARSSHH
ncbi:LAME_0H18536g1_1 [Lachancea meyersii CBS 8951]|uniref:LAME_0H18536g1_1 n=1 Tax=Lachancea meyersii CBS 8951 TaxID=1266667 RepID=A0A1G4KIR7_9SACH|nr:LAME_0H18536g1_1 [Lachancea meyersii CBS 8951]